jgi:hypothetical protein
VLSRRYGNPSLPSLLRRRRKPGESIGLRALLTARVRTRLHGPKTGKRAEALMGLSLTRVFSPYDRRGLSPELPRAYVEVLSLTGASESTTDMRHEALPEEG